MSVDFESLAARGRCDVSSLKLAAPLIEQGFTPPFLARYRRDELGGIDEESLWLLASAIENDARMQQQREKLLEVWENTELKDRSLKTSIEKANSVRMLRRISGRLRAETSQIDDATRLASHILNAEGAKDSDVQSIANSIEQIDDAEAAVESLDEALAHRLAGDPRIVGAAVRWLTKNAKIKVHRISDPHGESDTGKDSANTKKGKGKRSGGAEKTVEQTTAQSPADNPHPSTDPAGGESAAGQSGGAVQAVSSALEDAAKSLGEKATVAASRLEQTVSAVAETAAELTASIATSASEMSSAETASEASGGAEVASEQAATQTTSATAEASTPEATKPETAETTKSETAEPDTPAVASTEVDQAESEASDAAKKSALAGKPASPAVTTPLPDPPKKPKKMSPRQRRRKWMVSVLKSLSGKQLPATKLSAFQTVMLARALRSQVAECGFVYDAAKLVGQLQQTAGKISRTHGERLQRIIVEHEAMIRDAAEAAWWEDLQERASVQLVETTAAQLRTQMSRGSVSAGVVMAIDAIGPKTAATTIVAADGRVLHVEDLPCGLGKGPRSAAVAKMGELVHAHHVDLIVISNGPARRAMMVALSELIKQSPEGSLRYTLAERSGADAYAESSIAGGEMRSTPRRFRAAAWLAFSVLHPAQALAKVDPLKLRLNAFQKELAEDALRDSLEDILVSGASRGGVDVNGAPASWLARLPGMDADRAKSLDARRRDQLFETRDQIVDGGFLDGAASNRQALPFLRVFGSEQPLDGTLIHPDDYRLASRLAEALSIELPPPSPPGYQAPDYSDPQQPIASEATLSESLPAEPAAVAEDFSAAKTDTPEFSLDPSGDETAPPPEDSNESVAALDDADSATNETASLQISEPESSPPKASGDQAAAAEVVAAEDMSPSADSNSDSPSAESTPADPSGEEGSADASADSSEAPAAEAVADAENDASAKSEEVAEDTSIETAAAPPAVKHPLPDKDKIDKCIKEWQVGSKRTRQIVHWLCDPFGDGDASGVPPAVMTSVPTTNDLAVGDQAIGVVVGMTHFGVFVELSPDCSGLVHISGLADAFVEDMHEVVSIGDVVTAWVTETDAKKRRLSLSLISPSQRQNRDGRRGPRDSAYGDGPRRGGSKPYGRGGPSSGESGRGNQGRRDAGRGGRAEGGRGGRAEGGRGGRAEGGRGPGGRGDGPARGGRGSAGGGGRGGRAEGGRGRGRSDGRGDSRRGGRGKGPRKLESYRVESTQEVAPITDEMKSGTAPMRSFGDLAQFMRDANDPKQPADAAASVDAGEMQPPSGSAPASSPSEAAPSAPPIDDPPPIDSPPDATPSSDASSSGTTEPPSNVSSGGPSEPVASAGDAAAPPNDAPEPKQTSPSGGTTGEA